MKSVTVSLQPWVVVGFLGLLVSTPFSAAQDDTPSAAVEANNPLADIRAFNVQNYYIPELSGLPDSQANTFWLRNPEVKNKDYTVINAKITQPFLHGRLEAFLAANNLLDAYYEPTVNLPAQGRTIWLGLSFRL